jgi:hypothetical protein
LVSAYGGSILASVPALVGLSVGAWSLPPNVLEGVSMSELHPSSILESSYDKQEPSEGWRLEKLPVSVGMLFWVLVEAEESVVGWKGNRDNFPLLHLCETGLCLQFSRGIHGCDGTQPRL